MSTSGLDPLLEDAPCGFISFGDDGVVEHANRTLLGLLALEPSQVIGRHVETILTVGSRIFYQTHWFPLLRMHGRAEEIFLMLRDATGGQVGALVNAVRHERGGKPVYDCVVMRVLEREKYESELLRARKAAELAQAESDRQRVVLQEANERLMQQADELEVQQQQLQDQAAELETASEELQTTNETLLERTHELELARAAADEANLAKSSFLAVMSHELRTPLNAIAGYTDLIELGIQGPVTDAQRESLLRIKRSQRHLLRLINQVLNLARIESGVVDYTMQETSAAALMEEVAPLVEPQLTEKGLAFEVDVRDEHVMYADREKVQQILLNLLSNAIKFTDAGGCVAVKSRVMSDDGSVIIAVTDTGRGIPAARLQSVFEPFIQVEAAVDQRQGTGLGLSISRDLARGMDGDLSAESVEGQGSTFTLRLPGPLGD